MTERTLADVLAELNDNQITFVVARVNTRYDTEAAKIAHIHAKTPAKWRQDGAPLDEAVRLMKLNSVSSALETLKAAADLAAQTLVDEMQKGGDEKIRAAFGVLDRVGLPAINRIEASSAGVLVVLDGPPER